MDVEAEEDKWDIVHKFDMEEKQLEDFLERCNEYQTDKSATILACIPVAVIKVLGHCSS